MHEMTRLIRKASPAFRVSLFYCPRTYIFMTKQRKTVIKMSLWELLILAVGLSMDAFAVSVCKGLSVKKLKAKHMLIVGAYFGGFQALMPLLGYILGIQFQSMIQQFDHWIAFVLLVLIGLSMIKESREEAENLNDSFSFKTMLPLAVATSIDALAVGVTFAFLQVKIVPAISFIGATTFIQRRRIPKAAPLVDFRRSRNTFCLTKNQDGRTELPVDVPSVGDPIRGSPEGRS